MTSLVDRLLPDKLWQRIQPLLPAPPPRSRGGVPRRVPDRNCVAALVFMTRTSTSSRRCCWTSSAPPAGSTLAGSTRLLQPAGAQRGDLTGANPVDRGKAGSKLHLAGEAGGLPRSVILSAANANDATMFEAVLDDIPPIRMPTRRRRRRPGKVHGENV